VCLSDGVHPFRNPGIDHRVGIGILECGEGGGNGNDGCPKSKQVPQDLKGVFSGTGNVGG